MEENETTTTQPTAQGADGQEQVEGNGEGNAPEGKQQFAGFQKRIDELTAQVHESRAQMAQLQQMNTQLLTQLATPQSAAPAAPPDPFAKVDWQDPDSVKAAMQNAVSQGIASERRNFEARIAELQGQMQQSEVSTLLTSRGYGHPTLVQRAQQLAAGARRNGMPLTANDVANFVLGEALSGQIQGFDMSALNAGNEGDAADAAPYVAPRQQPRRPVPFNIPQGGAPAPRRGNVPPNGGGGELPPNFHNLTYDQQEAILEKRLKGKTF